MSAVETRVRSCPHCSLHRDISNCLGKQPLRNTKIACYYQGISAIDFPYTLCVGELTASCEAVQPNSSEKWWDLEKHSTPKELCDQFLYFGSRIESTSGWFCNVQMCVCVYNVNSSVTGRNGSQQLSLRHPKNSPKEKWTVTKWFTFVSEVIKSDEKRQKEMKLRKLRLLSSSSTNGESLNAYTILSLFLH